MTIVDLYRCLLRLYPADFHQQFSEEMCSVFERKASECSERETASITFALPEFINITKGACILRMKEMFAAYRINAEAAAATSTYAPINAAEADQQRSEAIKKMVTCIAKHDFAQARLYSYEEIRLKRLVQQFQREIPVESSRTA